MCRYLPLDRRLLYSLSCSSRTPLDECNEASLEKNDCYGCEWLYKIRTEKEWMTELWKCEPKSRNRDASHPGSNRCDLLGATPIDSQKPTLAALSKTEQRSHSAQKASNDALVLSLFSSHSHLNLDHERWFVPVACGGFRATENTHTHTNSQPFHTLSDLLLPSVRFQTNPTLDCPESVSVSLISSQPWLPIRLSIPSPHY